MSDYEFGDPRLPARFWAKVRVNEDTGCWEWTGRTTAGYGKIGLDGKEQLAHRVAYAALVGDLPDYAPGGLQLDHLCRFRACVAPAHLELVSQRVNVLRGESPPADHAQRTHCPRGHALAGDNLVPSKLRRDGGRQCCTCNRATTRAHSAATRDAHVALGITQAAYRATFDRSRATAEHIIAAIESGVTPEAILAQAVQ